MSSLRYTNDHEWLRAEEDGTVTVGITPYARDALGEVVFVQLMGAGNYGKGDEVAVIESVKAAGSISMPLDGEVVLTNDSLADNPGAVNEESSTDAWFFKFRPSNADDLSQLLDEVAYRELLAQN